MTQSKRASNAGAAVHLQPVEIRDLEKKLGPKPAPAISTAPTSSTATSNRDGATNGTTKGVTSADTRGAGNPDAEGQNNEGFDREPLSSAASRPAQRNMVLPCFSKTGRERVFAELGVFFEVHPSRFFVLDLRQETQKISIFLGEPAEDSAGSQVVVIEGNPQQIPEIVGLVRASLLIGVHTELALFDGALLPEALSGLLPLCDDVIMESHLFDHLGGSGWGDGRAALFTELLAGKLSIVDSGWLRLSAVREELRRAFDQRGLEGPSSIEIKYTNPGAEATVASIPSLPTVVILMAGWCCARLGAVSLVPLASGALAELEDGSKIAISFSLADPVQRKPVADGLLTSGADLTGLTIAWRNGRISISIGDGKISTNTDGNTPSLSSPIHSERIFEGEADTDRWRRYFVIGESTTNYRGSLEIALALFR